MSDTNTLQDVTIYYLKMAQKPNNFKTISPEFSIKKMENPIDPEGFFKLYCAVGSKHHWTDRLGMTNEELSQVINDPKSSIYNLIYDGRIVGFSELVQEENYIELLYFGLRSDEVGKGLGPSFLQMMIEQAWATTPQWIQLNTCSMDHPKALPLYQRMGFEIVGTKNSPRLFSLKA